MSVRAILFGGVMLCHVTAHAATYYVRSSGSDANDGLTPATAFASLAKASDLLLNGGDRVVVGPGTYQEGNLSPRRSGREGAAIKFIADASGAQTGDPAGPVIIAPDPNDDEQTTGFLLFGKEHIVIDGFTIVGARDAGIQVRSAPRTGVPSANIVVRRNTVSDGGGGIEVEAEGSIRIESNTMANNSNANVVVSRGDAVLLQSNHVQGGAGGLFLDQCRSAAVVDNDISGILSKAIRASAVAMLSITMNRVQGLDACVYMEGSAPVGDAVIEGNNLQTCGTGIEGGVARSLTVRSNQLLGVRKGLSASAGSSATLEGNNFDGLNFVIVGAPMVSARGNRFDFSNLLADAEFLSITGNTGTPRVESHATMAMEVFDNSFGKVEISAPKLQFARNDVLLSTELLAIDSATITANVFHDQLILTSRQLGMRAARAIAEPGFRLHLEGNQFTAAQIGRGSNPIHGGVELISNTAAGSLQVFSDDDVVLKKNTSNGGRFVGLAATLSGDSSRAEISGNTVRDSQIDGILLTGARGASISDNIVSGSKGTGVTLRNSSDVSILRNDIHDNVEGGIGINTDSNAAGDCNRDSVVTVGEFVVAVDIALGQRPRAGCSWVDEDGNGAITVDELVRVQDYLSTATSTMPPPSDFEQVISDNRIANNAKYGIEIFTSQPTRIESNTVSDSAAIGISVTSNAPGLLTLRENTVERSADAGIRVAGGERAVLTQNIVRNSQQNGIELDATTSAEFVANRVSDSMRSGIRLTNTNAVVCSNNDVQRSGAVGVFIAAGVGERLQAQITGNHVQQSAGDGVNLRGAAAASLRDNVITEAQLNGLATMESSLVEVRDNTIRNSGAAGIAIGSSADATGRDHVFTGNTVSASGESGIRAYGRGVLIATNNDIRHSGGGGLVMHLSGEPAQAVVIGNVLGSNAADGLFLNGLTRGTVQNNISHDNGDSGVLIRASARTQIANNLVYANNNDGIAIGTGAAAGIASRDAFVVSNTVFQNRGQGVVIGAPQSPSIGAYVEHNILHRNQQLGFAVDRLSSEGLSADFNLNDDGYGNLLTPGAHDIDADPLFVDADGADATLGGDGYADDDFHLQTGDLMSPAIDAGRDTAVTIGISGTAVAGATADNGLLDLGYHYNASPRID